MMFGLKRSDLFIKAYGPDDLPAPMWNTLEASHGNVFMGPLAIVEARKYKLDKFYRHIPIHIHKFTERELEEIVILKLKG